MEYTQVRLRTLLASIVLIGVGVMYLFWFRPWWFHTRNPIDPSAPAWGSSQKYSSDEGFLLGKWISHTDSSTARQKNEFAQAVLATSTECIEFLHGGRFIWNDGRETVSGKWMVDATGIIFEPETVNGTSAKTALERYQGQIGLLKDDPGKNLSWLNEGSAVKSVQRLGPLQLMEDKKRLYYPGNIDHNGQTFLGTIIWDRVRK